jgi:hypothetical protein
LETVAIKEIRRDARKLATVVLVELSGIEPLASSLQIQLVEVRRPDAKK